MIEQYLLNTNEITTVLILPKILKLNKALGGLGAWGLGFPPCHDGASRRIREGGGNQSVSSRAGRNQKRGGSGEARRRKRRLSFPLYFPLLCSSLCHFKIGAFLSAAIRLPTVKGHSLPKICC